MSAKYSQWKAFVALCKAALKSITKSPSSVIFTIAFPLIFILVFGFFSNKNFMAVNIALAPNTDTNNVLVQALQKDKGVSITKGKSTKELTQMLRKNEITAILDIHNNNNNNTFVHITSGSNQTDNLNLINEKLKVYTLNNNPALVNSINRQVAITQTTIQSRDNKTIDFILPGQLGFSLLAASIFGTAFVFFSLRQTLVLKRFFATPVRKYNILLAEGTARMLFQLVGALLIILIGKYFLGFTLVKGWITTINLLILSAISVLVFMAYGFIISGIAKNESTIPPLSNILTLPQFLLAGTFFPISAFPNWLQVIARIFPLTYFNEAARAIASDGASLWQVRYDILIILAWGVLGYFVASKVFKWE